MACITADTYCHFGRLGGGAVMGAKNLKAIMIHGDGSFPLPEGSEYQKIFDRVYKDVTDAGQIRVFRGGSWFNYAANCRSASRYRYLPEFRDYDLGFRVAAVRVELKPSTGRPTASRA